MQWTGSNNRANTTKGKCNPRLLTHVYRGMKIFAGSMRMIIPMTLAYAALPGTNFAYGQASHAADTTFIAPHSLTNNATVYLGQFGRSVQIHSRTNHNEAATTRLSPNSSAFIGASGQYKKLFLYLEASVPGTHKVSPRETPVRGYGIFLSHFKQKWGVTGFAFYNNGLLMRNEPAMRSASMMNYGSRGDITMITAGAHIYRFFNPAKFSYPAAAAAAVQQKRSAGSWALMLTPSARWLSSNMGLISEQAAAFHFTGYQQPIEKVNLFGLQIKPGYVHNFIVGKEGLFIAPMVFAGAGADWHVLRTIEMETSSLNLNTGFRGKLVMGYNGPRWFATIDMLVDVSHAYVYNSRVSNRYSEASVNLGLRF